MPNKHQKIYIAIIVVCFLATGGVLYFGFFSNPSTPQAPATTTSDATSTTNQTATSQVDNTATAGTLAGGSTVYNPPAVFPNDTKFDFTVLNSSKFKNLVPIPDLTLGQAGRDNPFSQ
jgi:hypothetical protein